MSPKRSHTVLPVGISLDREAAEILRHYCPPGTKSAGRLVSRLLFEHHARLEEKRRLRASVIAALDGVPNGR